MRICVVVFTLGLASCSDDLGALHNFQDKCLAEVKTKIESPSSMTILRITAANSPGGPSKACLEAADIDSCERLRVEALPHNYRAPRYYELADGSPIDYWADITFDLKNGTRRYFVCEGHGVKGKAAPDVATIKDGGF